MASCGIAVASWLVFGFGTPILGLGLLFSFFGNARENARRSSCQSNLKQIALGLRQYRQDFDQKLPLVSLHSAPPARLVTNSQWAEKWPAFGWADSLQPYQKSVCIYQCPAETNSPVAGPNGAGYIDYWFNARLAGSRAFRAALITLGDGNGLGTARYAVKGLPANWRDAPREKSWNGTQSPWFERHKGGANYAFADGHVKWLRPEDAAAPQLWKPNS